MNYLNFDINPRYIPLIILFIIWSLFWKGLALWHAVKREDKKWFIILLIINSFSILELIYLYFIVKIKSVSLPRDSSEQ